MGTMPYSIACLPDLSSMILNTPRRHAGPDPDIYDCSERIAGSSPRDGLNGEAGQEFLAAGLIEVRFVARRIASSRLDRAVSREVFFRRESRTTWPRTIRCVRLRLTFALSILPRLGSGTPKATVGRGSQRMIRPIC